MCYGSSGYSIKDLENGWDQWKKNKGVSLDGYKKKNIYYDKSDHYLYCIIIFADGAYDSIAADHS